MTEQRENLHVLLDQVHDEPSFLEFVRALIADRSNGSHIKPIGQGESGWENDTIEDFLESGHAWAEDSDFGDRQNLAGASPWRKFAAFLYAGKIYE